MNYRLLIIDDELLIRMSLESGMTDLGYQVKSAENIREGLALAESFHPSAILLDNRLGNDSGLAHVAELRRLDEDMMIILMTAYGSVLQAVEAMKLGVSHYIQKPFDLEEVDLVKLPELDAPRDKRRGNGLAFIKIHLAAQRVNRSSILFFFYDASTRSFQFKAVKL